MFHWKMWFPVHKNRNLDQFWHLTNNEQFSWKYFTPTFLPHLAASLLPELVMQSDWCLITTNKQSILAVKKGKIEIIGADYVSFFFSPTVYLGR